MDREIRQRLKWVQMYEATRNAGLTCRRGICGRKHVATRGRQVLRPLDGQLELPGRDFRQILAIRRLGVRLGEHVAARSRQVLLRQRPKAFLRLRGIVLATQHILKRSADSIRVDDRVQLAVQFYTVERGVG
jgi:hypothetical protein